MKTLMAAEAAELLLVSRDAVKSLCNSGKVPGAVRRANKWFLPAAWVYAEVRRRERAAGRREPGRPTEIARRVRAADGEKTKKTAEVDT